VGFLTDFQENRMDAGYWVALVAVVALAFAGLYARERSRRRRVEGIVAWRDRLDEYRARRRRGDPVMPEWYDEEG
jgi:hypothetical protein